MRERLAACARLRQLSLCPAVCYLPRGLNIRRVEWEWTGTMKRQNKRGQRRENMEENFFLIFCCFSLQRKEEPEKKNLRLNGKAIPLIFLYNSRSKINLPDPSDDECVCVACHCLFSLFLLSFFSLHTDPLLATSFSNVLYVIHQWRKK